MVCRGNLTFQSFECEYDEVGYKRMRYDKQTRNSAIW